MSCGCSAGLSFSGGAPKKKSSKSKSPKAKAVKAVKAVKTKTVKELYEIAKKLDIKGRSKMNKDALTKAIKKAGGKV